MRDSLLAFNITDPSKILMPKALCLVSHFSFIENYKVFLRSLYSIHLSKKVLIPLERHISNFVDEIPIPNVGGVRLEYDIGNQSLSFYLPRD